MFEVYLHNPYFYDIMPRKLSIFQKQEVSYMNNRGKSAPKENSVDQQTILETSQHPLANAVIMDDKSDVSASNGGAKKVFAQSQFAVELQMHTTLNKLNKFVDQKFPQAQSSKTILKEQEAKITGLTKKLAGLEKRHTTTLKALQAANQKIETLQSCLQTTKSDNATPNTTSTSLQKDKESLQKQLEAEKANTAKAQQESTELKKQVEDLKKSQLKKAQESSEAQADATKLQQQRLLNTTARNYTLLGALAGAFIVGIIYFACKYLTNTGPIGMIDMQIQSGGIAGLMNAIG